MKKHWIHFIPDSTPLRHLKSEIDRLQWNVEKTKRDLLYHTQMLEIKEKQTERYLLEQEWTAEEIAQAKQKANG